MPETPPVFLTAKTWIPIGSVVVGVFTLISAVTYIQSLGADVRYLKSEFSAHVSDGKSRDSSIESRMQSVERTQAVVDAKLDSILKSLEDIRKKLNIN